MAEFDDNVLNRLARKIALSDGVPPDAIEKARSLLNDEGDAK